MKHIFFLLFIVIYSHCCFSNCNDSLLREQLGITKIYASNYAVYYAQEADIEYVKMLDSSLQVHVPKLNEIFKHTIDTTVEVVIYPEFSYALCVCDLDSSKIYALGCTRYRRITLVSPNAKSADKLYKLHQQSSTIVHEYAHALTFEMIGPDHFGKIKPWLREGIAFLSEPHPFYLNNEWAINSVSKAIENNQVPKFKDLENSYGKVFPHRGVWAAWLTEFLIYKYGWNTVIDMILNYNKFPKNIHLSRKQLQKEWEAYTKERVAVLR